MQAVRERTPGGGFPRRQRALPVVRAGNGCQDRARDRCATAGSMGERPSRPDAGGMVTLGVKLPSPWRELFLGRPPLLFEIPASLSCCSLVCFVPSVERGGRLKLRVRGRGELFGAIGRARWDSGRGELLGFGELIPTGRKKLVLIPLEPSRSSFVAVFSPMRFRLRRVGHVCPSHRWDEHIDSPPFPSCMAARFGFRTGGSQKRIADADNGSALNFPTVGSLN